MLPGLMHGTFLLCCRSKTSVTTITNNLSTLLHIHKHTHPCCTCCGGVESLNQASVRTNFRSKWCRCLPTSCCSDTRTCSGASRRRGRTSTSLGDAVAPAGGAAVANQSFAELPHAQVLLVLRWLTRNPVLTPRVSTVGPRAKRADTHAQTALLEAVDKPRCCVVSMPVRSDLQLASC